MSYKQLDSATKLLNCVSKNPKRLRAYVLRGWKGNTNREVGKWYLRVYGSPPPQWYSTKKDYACLTDEYPAIAEALSHENRRPLELFCKINGWELV